MNKKLTYFKISEPLLLFMWLVLSLLGFPIVNIGFFADPHNTVAGVIFYILISLIAAVAVLNLIIGIKIKPKSYTIPSVFFSVVMIGFVWVESIWVSYEPNALPILFNGAACLFLVLSIIISVLPFRKKKAKTA